MDEILRLGEEGAFLLLLPRSVRAEIKHPHTPAEVNRSASSMIFSLEVDLAGAERDRYERVRSLIQGNARPGQHDRDAFHLFESAKYGGRHFLTNDGRLLKKAQEIWDMLHLKVLKPSDFLAAYKTIAQG